MQKENNQTVGQWCDQWFTANRHKWNGNTEGGYRNLIYSHILPGIGSVTLSALTKQAVTDFYDMSSTTSFPIRPSASTGSAKSPRWKRKQRRALTVVLVPACLQSPMARCCSC